MNEVGSVRSILLSVFSPAGDGQYGKGVSPQGCRAASPRGHEGHPTQQGGIKDIRK